MTDLPAFEMIYPDRAYRVWTDGRTEGFEPDAILINRIPQHTNSAIARALDRKAAA